MGLMRTLDAGTMGGDSGSWPFLFSMFAVTIGGVFIVSTLIGVLTTGVEGKLEELRGRGVNPFPNDFRPADTAAAADIAKEIAKALAEAGARVLLHGRSRERLLPRLEELRGAGRAADTLGFDMADRPTMRAAVAGAGPIDILVHNVGERDRRPFAEIEPEDFARLIDVDLVAAHALVKLVAPGMIERGWGRLILVTSIVADPASAAPGSAAPVSPLATRAAASARPTTQIPVSAERSLMTRSLGVGRTRGRRGIGRGVIGRA